MAQKQVLQQQLKQTITPQQMEVVGMLELPILKLEERVKHELEENPALEEGEPSEDVASEEECRDASDYTEDDYEPSQESSEESDSSSQDYDEEEDSSEKSQSSADDDMFDVTVSENAGNDGYNPDDGSYDSDYDSQLIFTNYSEEMSFSEYLKQQLYMQTLPESILVMAEYIIDSLNPNGFLPEEETNIPILTQRYNSTYSTQHTETEMYEALDEVQKLEPAGVAARNLGECFRIQLERRDPLTPLDEMAIDLLDEHYDDFIQGKKEKIKSAMGISDEDLIHIYEELKGLSMCPSNGFPGRSLSEDNVTIVPDFYYDSSTQTLQLNMQGIPYLRVNESFQLMLEEYKDNGKNQNASHKEVFKFTKQKVEKAQLFISALEQRSQTLMNIMLTIIHFQNEFFQGGDETTLHPLTMKEVAEKAQCDVSTVSRVAKAKYVQTNFGTFALKLFFSEGIVTASGEEVSTREVKSILHSLIEAEDKTHPLTDEQLCHMLREKGYPIARRTVAKYREQLGIPITRLRKN